jgi:rfaE bifunctional protein nucleotidyltransferase chain/domain
MHAPPSFEAKICPPNEAVARAAALARPLVFTNGVVDILHRGHATYLAQARALGASLVVAVNSDDSVRTLAKGPDRPINTLADRVALLAALEAVTLVTWFEAPTPLDLIVALRPGILVKGGDWDAEHIVGARETAGWGGQVVSIPFAHERSTSSVLARIREAP